MGALFKKHTPFFFYPEVLMFNMCHGGTSHNETVTAKCRSDIFLNRPIFSAVIYISLKL